MRVELFGEIATVQCLSNEEVNFKNFQYAILTLFRLCPGEGWDCIMYDLMDTTTGGTPIAVIFIFAWILVVNFICLSLFIAVLLGNLSAALDEAAVQAQRAARRRLMLTLQKQSQILELELVRNELLTSRR